MERGKTVEAKKHYGFLYCNSNDPHCGEVKNVLTKGGIRFWEIDLSTVYEPNFVSPTFVTREGTFRGEEGIRAYLGWFIYDPLYHEKSESSHLF
jgi:hypothetical protein